MQPRRRPYPKPSLTWGLVRVFALHKIHYRTSPSPAEFRCGSPVAGTPFTSTQRPGPDPFSGSFPATPLGPQPTPGVGGRLHAESGIITHVGEDQNGELWRWLS